ncbi:penicillin-binding protein 2 [Natranaerobius trueperi]|uniref:Penicillin-binding protein 2 n=1 Tax=Natranaerobius trueperi TaxID=759412 RepID=A0A226C0M0_9FIRM|nr:penicillin-binding protein 2 [Natranaerobius trueperi]OWZ83920.1 penicillin-binding protein 2 [Natranaerobius trueperi]
MSEDRVTFKRIQIFFVITIFLCVVLVARLAYLQVVEGEYYQQVSEENRVRRLTIQPPRGEIYTRDGEVLAKNSPGYSVSLMDVNNQDADEVVDYLSKYLDIDKEEIEDKIRSQRFRQFEPVTVKSGLSFDQVAHLAEKRTDLPGVILEIQPERVYPKDKLMSHIVGYTGEITGDQLDERMREKGYTAGDIIGQAGLEKTYQEYLKGEAGVHQVEVNRFGRIINYLGDKEPTPGNDLQLTIDCELQKFLAETTKETIETIMEEENYEEPPGGASVVVLDPNSGEILSMLSEPKYNPNTFYEDYSDIIKDPLRPLNNRAISDTFPPGSTYKMVTAIAALEEGELRPNETIMDQGRYWNPPHPRNFQNRAFGRIDIVDALKYSSNVFFAELGHRLGIDSLSEWSRRFGLGSTTGLEDLDGEIAGTVADRDFKKMLYQEPENQIWYPGETIIASMGQGFHTYTPLQLANFASMLANEGTHYRPYLVDEVIDHTGEQIEDRNPEIINELDDVDDESWDLTREGMRRVGQSGGTAGWVFHDLPFDIGLKTGSAEVTGKSPHGWIIGFAPYDEPEIAFSVLVEHGGGSSRAASLARALIDFYFDLEDEDEVELETHDTGEYVDE